MELYETTLFSPQHQPQLALHSFGTESQYHSTEDIHEVSKATVCRYVRKVANAVNRVLLH